MNNWRFAFLNLSVFAGNSSLFNDHVFCIRFIYLDELAEFN